MMKVSQRIHLLLVEGLQLANKNSGMVPALRVQVPKYEVCTLNDASGF